MAERMADPMEGTENSPLQLPSPQTIHSSRATTATLEASSPSQPAAQLPQEQTTVIPSNIPFLQSYAFSLTMAHDPAPSDPPPQVLQSPFFNLPGLSSLEVSRDELQPRDAPSSTNSPAIDHPSPAPGPSNDSPSDPSPSLPTDASPPAPSDPSETVEPSRPPLTNSELVELERQLRRQERRLDRREERREQREERREERHRQREARREARRENNARIRAARQERLAEREARARALVDKIRAERREKTEKKREEAMMEMEALFVRLAEVRERKERVAYEKRGGGPLGRLKIRLGQSFGVLGGEVLHAHLNHHQTHSPLAAEYIASYGRDAACAASLAADEAADAMSTAPITRTAAEKREVEQAVLAVTEVGTESPVPIGRVLPLDIAIFSEALRVRVETMETPQERQREALRVRVETMETPQERQRLAAARARIADIGGLRRADLLRQAAELERWRTEVVGETEDIERRMAELARRARDMEHGGRRVQEVIEGERRELEERRREWLHVTRIELERVDAVIEARRVGLPRAVHGDLERRIMELDRSRARLPTRVHGEDGGMGPTRMTEAAPDLSEVTDLTAEVLQAALARIVSTGNGGGEAGRLEEMREEAEERARALIRDGVPEGPPVVREEMAGENSLREAVNGPGWTWPRLESPTAPADESEEASDEEDLARPGILMGPVEGGDTHADPESAGTPMDEDDLPRHNLERERIHAAILAARDAMGAYGGRDGSGGCGGEVSGGDGVGAVYYEGAGCWG
ncbi:hypothetical protein V498_06691 [Pseudogymnoascus sp. VKM F-4517 (FW-2822)]|nr:hypothetical protein V498_06691 [Pseudogymnoascus sp. VKM F-4517 (FW-2822)]